MKKNQNRNFNFVFLLWIVFSIVSFITIIVLSIIYRTEEHWKKVLFDLVCGVLSAFIVTGGLGLIIDAFRRHYVNALIDIKRLRDIGIENVGTGTFTRQDERKMFGVHTFYKNYPYCLKFMFITGNAFLDKYKQEIIKCINEGCKVQILLADCTSENSGYLERFDELFAISGTHTPFVKQIKEESLRYLKYINDRIDKCCNGSLCVRYYRDEYINSFRAAKYTSENSDISYYWINLQSLTNATKDLSVALKGAVGDYFTDKENENFYLSYERGFDFLWEKYKDTEQNLKNV